MSTHEIEDVLSSIRRLVSDDLRPGSSRPPEGQGQAGPTDKLILTPALRVVTATDAPLPAGDEAAWPAGSFGTAAPLGTGPGAPVDEVVARLGASVPEEEWESPFGDPEVWAAAEESSEVDTVATAPAFVARRRLTLEAAEDAPSGFSDVPMAGFAEDADQVPESSAPDAAEDTAEVAPRRVIRREVMPPQDDIDWADAAEAAVRADLEQGTEDQVIADLYGTQADGMAFDEAVLRDLVRDLIREELASTLGERITRNVRKLVRAEIARALALRDFD
ncbi:hypothetical protein [Pseudotabrizicola formosa]|uniref:hypothetical protein n=1 Tax=Pseudotabrizicola formosa TaxID=2030009 RepID=UPI00143CFDE4|nr:hypothetical protein [Pseudotabrizicola formosa]